MNNASAAQLHIVDSSPFFQTGIMRVYNKSGVNRDFTVNALCLNAA